MRNLHTAATQLQALPIIASAIMALAVLIIAFWFIQDRRQKAKIRNLASLPKYPTTFVGQTVQLVDRSQSALYGLVERTLPSRYRYWLIEKLRAGGLYGQEALAKLIGQKALYATAGAIVGLLYFAKEPVSGLLYLLGFTVLGYFVPDILAINTATKRQDAIDKSLPDAIDLLDLCVDSGLTFEQAASRVSLGLQGPVAEEFAAILAEMQLGNSRNEAVMTILARTKSAGLTKFLSALLQVDRLGIPLSSVLSEQAHQMRAKRKDDAREQAQKVTVKILMPLMFCFLPAVFIVIIGPALAGLLVNFAGMNGN